MKSDWTAIDQELQYRCLPDGGFAETPGGDFRPDATAWAALALSRIRNGASPIGQALRRLADAQTDDGRIAISPEHPEAYWPTPVCILAWKGFQAFAKELSGATRFLLATTGKHWPKHPDSPLAHDTALQGWPWVADTHSWVEPTALAILALRVSGQEGHPRVAEAVKMLLDRQLPDGGWNYGNTLVYGHELQPMPDTTGLALQALAGLVPQASVERSLGHLDSGARYLRTPFSLAWALCALSAWGARPADAGSLIEACLERQEIWGEYSTSQLSLLQLAWLATDGLQNIFV